MDKRCDPADFDETPDPSLDSLNAFFPGACPASSKVGEADVYLVNDADSGACPDAPLDCLLAGFDMVDLGGTLHGEIFLLKTDPEVPVKLGTLFTSESYQNFDFETEYGGLKCTTAPATPCPIYPKSVDTLAPVTNRSADLDDVDDFRVRTIPDHRTDPPNAILPTVYGHDTFDPLSPTPTYGTQLHIRNITFHLFGKVDPNETPGNTTDDVQFLTNPTRCDSWDSYTYATSWDGGGGNLAMDPKHPDDNDYVKSAVDAVTPDCSSRPPFNVGATATLTSGARDANPGMTVKVTNPTAFGDDEAKKLVTTLPAVVSVDVDALSKVCSVADRNADSCPATSQVGTATIYTPMITAGLTGRIYMTKSPNASLPYLSIYVDGAIKFRMDATTRFVGPDSNQVETSFDALPQAPFTDFTVELWGGKSDSLLYTRKCSSSKSSWDDGPMAFAMNSYLGASKQSASDLKLDPCYGASKPAKISKCIKPGKKIKAMPKGIIDPASVASVQLLAGKKANKLKKLATDKKAPFAFKVTLKKSKFKKKKSYFYGYSVKYKDGKVVKTKANKFKICK